jgi:hypothetical protein
MPNQLTDSTTGRTSAWLAKSSSAYVMLVDPATGLPYKASGGGGGGSGFADIPYIDSTGQQFFYQDSGSGLTTYKTQAGVYVAYTPVGAVKPYSVAEVTALSNGTFAVQNTDPVIGGNAIAVKTDSSATTQPVSGDVGVNNFPATQAVSAVALPLPTGAATSALQTTLNTSITNGTQKTSIVQAFTYSPNNSTNGDSTAYSLTTGSTWFGTAEAAVNQNYATISVISTQAVTLAVYQYLDAAATIPDVPTYFLAIPANTPTSVPFSVQGNYVKLGVSNASGATSSLIVDTYFGPLPVEPATLTFAGNKKVSVQEQLVSISTLNSSTTQLTAGSSFTGVWEAVLNTASLQVSSIADQATTITVQQAQDAAGAKIVSSKVYTRAAGAAFAESLLVVGTYARLLVQNNGGATTTTFSAQTIYTPVMNQSPVGPDNSGNMPVGISQAVYGPTGTNAVFVGGTSQVQVTPAVTAASAYVTGNVVGGLITFANAVQGTVLSGVLESVTLAIKSTQTATFKLYLFSSAPATTFTDKTAPAIGTGDAAKLLDGITLTGADSGLGSNVTLYVADNIGKSLVLAGTALYGVLTVTGTPTFTTTSDVVVTASILKD